ncbi:MAG: phosphoenolpyruvate--protein phosphotransferase [Phycisphaerales bacterium]|nr:phosphoenolpyruvate--protein phosphotransferase [Phycisphaerales bacterium]
MEILRGISVSPGIAIAEAVVLDAEEYRIPRRFTGLEEVDEQCDIIVRAFAASIEELTAQRTELHGHVGQDAADIFNWHLGVLQAPQIREQITELIREKRYAAAYATSIVMRTYQRRFLKMQDRLLAERVRDVQDIERRLLRHILGETREDLAHLTRPVAIVAHDLSPSRTAQLSKAQVVGVALDVGGAASHTAILLRGLGRPAVLGVKDLSSHISGGDTIIIDGANGLVVVAPDEPTLAQYRSQQQTYVRIRDELGALRDLPAVTQDGATFKLLANIEFPHEVPVCLEQGADGVGLYRTEFLYLREGGEPSEEEQYEAYREAIESAGGKPVTIRTFDLGADKYTQEKSFEAEPNPMLGLRSIRYSLQRLDMFKVQLRAILRASTAGPVRLMFPLIISLMEYRQARMVLHDAMEDLDDMGVPFRRDIVTGIMVETPAAAIQCRDFAREVGFVSIGTNDLVQYLLAVDRGNERVSRFYTAAHPAVLRVIHDVIRTCKKAGVDCSLCGETAGEPLYTMLLAGLGLRSFSMAPHNIPEVKKLLRMCTVKQMERVARRALSFETERQVVNYLRSQTKKMLPDDPI